MTDTLSFPLSTKAKKLTHDIQFATDIGRDSPFDPFQGRDITKLFSDKKDESMKLMNFAKKPFRRPPDSTAVDFAKMPGREPVQSAFKSYYTNEPTATTYTPQVPLQGPHPHVSFPKAKRVLLANLGVTDVLEKWQQPKNGASSASDAHVDEKQAKNMQSNPEDLLSCRERAKLRAAQRPASQLSNRPGVSIGKSGLGVTASRNATKSSTPAPGASPRTSAAEYQLPWEAERAAIAAQKLKPRQKPTGRLSTSADPNIPTASYNIDGSPDIDLEGSHSLLQDSPQHMSFVSNADTQNNPASKDSIEEWLQKRHQMLSRFGLIGGSDTQNRKGGERRGLDLGAMPSRQAPIGFQRPQKEIHDNPYVPKDELTTKKRAIAHVELGKQAARFQRDDHLMKHLNHLLNYEHLSKLHQRTREAEMKSLMGLSSPVGHSGYDESGISSKSINSSPALERPLTAADEVAYHFSSLQAPGRKRIPHTSDAYLWASRDDEPLAAVLGGDPKPYKRAASKDLARLSTPAGNRAQSSTL